MTQHPVGDGIRVPTSGDVDASGVDGRDLDVVAGSAENPHQRLLRVLDQGKGGGPDYTREGWLSEGDRQGQLVGAADDRELERGDAGVECVEEVVDRRDLVAAGR